MNTAAQPESISFGRRLTQLAQEEPDRTGLIFVAANGEQTRYTRQDLDRRSNQRARLFAERGVDQDSTGVIGLPNCAEHVIAAYATWKLGAMTLPLRAAMPPRERNAILDLTSPDLVVSIWGDIHWSNLRFEELSQVDEYSDDVLPDRIANPGRAMGSGGSTGRPKMIVRNGPWAFPPGTFIKVFGPTGFYSSSVVWLIPGPLYHEAPFLSLHVLIFEGAIPILMERFDPGHVLDVIERHRPTALNVTPIMMQRILEIPDVEQRDLSSLDSVFHTGAPCAPWLKRAWIDLVGVAHVNEIYGGTEGNGYAMVNGVEWLDRPGTVGKPYLSEMKIVGDDGNELPRGDVGRIFSRSIVTQDIPFGYVGADQAPRIDGGFTWIGDLGWMDEDGYLYLADRRTDLIISGGANVYAAEVEAALSEHPGVADVVVVGLPDETWGERVHAIVQPHDMNNSPAPDDLNEWCRERLSAYKCPKSYEFIGQLPRTEAGKIRRSDLAMERANESAGIGKKGVATAD